MIANKFYLKSLQSSKIISQHHETDHNNPVSALKVVVKPDFNRLLISSKHLLSTGEGNVEQEDQEITLYQTRKAESHQEYQALLSSSNKRFYLAKRDWLQEWNTGSQSLVDLHAKFCSQYDLYYLDKSRISLCIDWVGRWSDCQLEGDAYPTTPLSASSSGSGGGGIGSFQSATLQIEYHAKTVDILQSSFLLQDRQDSDEDLMERQMAWTSALLSQANKSTEFSQHFICSLSKADTESWIQKRDQNLDFIEDLLWNFLCSTGNNTKIIDNHSLSIVFHCIYEKLESSELQPVFDRGGSIKCSFAKDIKKWLIESSLSREGGTTDSAWQSLSSIFQKYLDNPAHTVLEMSICCLKNRICQLLLDHSSNSLSSFDLSMIINEESFYSQPVESQLSSLVKLYNIYLVQHLLSDYVVGIPQQSLHSLLLQSHPKDETISDAPCQSVFNLSNELPKFDQRSMAVVKGVCERLDPEYWMCSVQLEEAYEFLFLVKSEEEEEDEEGVAEEMDSRGRQSSKYEQWIARLGS